MIVVTLLCTVQPRLGALQQLGHRDFYPDGGSVQQGCLFGIDALPGGALHPLSAGERTPHQQSEENNIRELPGRLRHSSREMYQLLSSA